MYDQLKQYLGEADISFAENVNLNQFTTFRIGGPCPLLIDAGTASHLKQVIQLLSRCDLEFYIFGRGSNILVSDQGVAMPVIHTKVDEPQIERDEMFLQVYAGTSLDQVAEYVIKQDLQGINFACGIPGTLGGAVVGNAGAFGHAVGEVIVEAEIISQSGDVTVLNNDQMKFNYRDSLLKHSDDIIVSAKLCLEKGDGIALAKERSQILKKRRQKHVDYYQTPCAGSFFKNIVQSNGERISAGKFLEEAGCKDLSYGDAAVYQNHANIIINNGSATAKDVIILSRMMQKRVVDAFGIKLEPEVRFIGEFD